jgi:hypothetical protein
MRTAASAAAVLGVTLRVSTTGEAATIKLATWNMNNLHFVVGEPLRSGAPARTEADYGLLRKYRDRLGADVMALQEVNGPKAAALVFPPEEYDPSAARSRRHRLNSRERQPPADRAKMNAYFVLPRRHW